MYQVFISGYRLAEVAYGKPYYVYNIQITESNSCVKYTIERRYSEFNTLHRLLKKKIGTTIAAFPPKRVRNCQPKVLEQRRAALELYVQKMLQLPTTKQQVLEFLGIENTRNNNRMISKRLDIKKISDNIGNDTKSNFAIGHHPVITFKCDPYIKADNTNGLPDIITQGALLGIYKSENY
ncbi:hypothetical protein PV327_008367 [Microctonus hyperodae]|uniref:PX domain-containing protein n=1 Tax=Microctonus hyperodae TaxID=165561 RepID=A0AA39F308_MICHY|nr:hypothetical protein PV327_008367 [Microctonus hyperodae]